MQFFFHGTRFNEAFIFKDVFEMRFAKIPDDVNPGMAGGFVKNEHTAGATDEDYDSEDERERQLLQLQVCGDIGL